MEVRAENDSIDLEIRLVEGKQFRIGRVDVRTGNTKTSDHVIRREIRTMPGDLFSRTDVIRTQRELNQLNYFNPEAFGINPVQRIPKTARSTSNTSSRRSRPTRLSCKADGAAAASWAHSV